MTNTRVIFRLITLLSCFIVGWVQGATIETVYCRIPFSVDMEYDIPVPMYLKCDMLEMNQTIAEYQQAVSLESDKTFFSLLQAMEKNDIDMCVSLALPKAPESASALSKKEAIIRLLATDWNKFVQSAEGSVRIMNIFFIGGERLYFLSNNKAQTEETDNWRVFIINAGNGTPFWDIDSSSVLRGLLMRVYQNQMKDSKQYAVQRQANCQYEAPMTPPDQKHTAYICFNGRAYSTDSDKTAEDNCDAAVDMLFLRYYLAKTGYKETISELLTSANSKKVYLEWLKTGDSNYLKWHFEQDWGKMPQINFVINADPVFIVFEKKGKNLRPVNVLYSSQDKKYRFVNFNVGTFLQQMFETKSFIEYINRLAE